MDKEVEEYKKSMQGRRTGRCSFDDPRRKNVSRRGIKQKLTLAEVTCPYCRHHKAFRTEFCGVFKCTRCGRDLNGA